MTIEKLIDILYKIRILAEKRNWKLQNKHVFCLYGTNPYRIVIARGNSVKYCNEYSYNLNNDLKHIDNCIPLDEKLIYTIRYFIPEANEVEFHLYSTHDAEDKYTDKVKDTLNIISSRISKS